MTQIVTNQVPPFEGRNLFDCDPFLRRIIQALTEDNFTSALSNFGAECGAASHFDLGRLANENPPKLRAFDRFGHRVNEVEYHPAYHELMRFSMRHGLHTSPWSDPIRGRLVARCAQNFMMTQVEAGHGCPITMTFAAVPALKNMGDAAEAWIPRLLSTEYDPSNRPAHEKSACTVGMAMTENKAGPTFEPIKHKHMSNPMARIV